MPRNYRLASALMRANWLIVPQAAEAQLPMLQSWLDKAQLHRDEDSDVEEPKPRNLLMGCFAARLDAGSTTTYKSFDEAPAGSTAILSINGVILKDDFCDYGMNTKAEQIRAAYQHPNINSLLIRFDSPGGQSNAPALAADAIREARAAGVPVLGWVDHGQASSAGYWIFASCSEGWLSQPSDQVGSIGGYQRIRKNTSTDVLEVYAPQSTQKNLPYRKAAEGDVSLLQGELAQTVDVFIASVEADRGDRLAKDGDHYQGGLFMGQKAVTAGLAEGICTFAQAVARVQQLAAEAAAPAAGDPSSVALPPSLSSDSSNPLLSVKYALVSAVLGASTGLVVDKEKGTYLNEAQLDALETHLTTAGATATELTTAKADLATAKTDLTTANTTAATEKKRADDAEAQLAAYANVPGKEHGNPKREGDDPQLTTTTDEVDPELAAVLAMKQELGIPNK